MRSPSAGITAALTAQGERPGYLLQITLGGTVLYLTNLDGFSYNSITWTHADFAVEGLSWDGHAGRNVRLVFGDQDLVWWAFVLLLQFADAPVLIWQVYDSATNEAEPVYSGRCGKPVRNGLMTVIECANEALLKKSPRTLLQYLVDPVYLLPSGTVISIGSTQFELTRN